MTDPGIRERLRDYLCANGPTRPGEVAAACGVPLRVVMAEIDRGALRAAQTLGPTTPTLDRRRRP